MIKQTGRKQENYNENDKKHNLKKDFYNKPQSNIKNAFDSKTESKEKKEYSQNKKSSKGNALYAFAYLSQIGITMVASVAIGVFIGKFLDDLLGTTPWLLLIFSLMGVGAAIINIYKISNS